jgi:hypothetical protein
MLLQPQLVVYTHALYPMCCDTTFLETRDHARDYGWIRQISALDLSGAVSHHIVLVYPGGSPNAFVTSFPSCYVYENLRVTLSNHKLEVVARLYQMYVRVSNAKNNAVNDVAKREDLSE